jgi:hypothetical protein
MEIEIVARGTEFSGAEAAGGFPQGETGRRDKLYKFDHL